MHQPSTTLAILPDGAEDRRIRVDLRHKGGGIALVQESFSPGVGWFSQGQIELSPEQIGELRAALGVTEFQRPGKSRPGLAGLSIYRAG